MAGYVQDYDEQFPINMNDAAAVQAKLVPYVAPQTPSPFRCPATKNAPYVFNADLSGVSLPAIEDPAVTFVLQDSKPHPDGKLTVAFVDNRVERGGQIQIPPGYNNESLCIDYARSVNTGLIAYSQDYDEILPPFVGDQGAQSYLTPYMTFNSYKFNCPSTFLPYRYNPAISGKPLAFFPDLDQVKSVKDAAAHAVDGRVTLLFLSGRAVRVKP